MDLKFIRMLKEATLKSQFSAPKLGAFQNPQEHFSSPSDGLRAAKGGSVVGLGSVEREGPAGGRCP